VLLNVTHVRLAILQQTIRSRVWPVRSATVLQLVDVVCHACQVLLRVFLVVYALLAQQDSAIRIPLWAHAAHVSLGRRRLLAVFAQNARPVISRTLVALVRFARQAILRTRAACANRVWVASLRTRVVHVSTVLLVITPTMEVLVSHAKQALAALLVRQLVILVVLVRHRPPEVSASTDALTVKCGARLSDVAKFAQLRRMLFLAISRALVVHATITRPTASRHVSRFRALVVSSNSMSTLAPIEPRISRDH